MLRYAQHWRHGMIKPNPVSIEELIEVCELTVKLTELRQKECSYLCIENFSPSLFAELLARLAVHKTGEAMKDFTRVDSTT